MMPRFYLRLILLTITIFTGLLLLIYAQPYDDRDLRELLSPQGCPASCFMGIRPGVTTGDKALKILKATGWLAQYDYEDGEASINIKWNDNSPAWLPRNAVHGSTSLWIEKGLVSQFNIETNLTLGTIQLTSDERPFQHIAINHFNGRSFLIYYAIYLSKGLNISVSRDCSHEHGTITYQDKVYLHYAQLTMEADVPLTYHHSWLDVMRTSC